MFQIQAKTKDISYFNIFLAHFSGILTKPLLFYPDLSLEGSPIYTFCMYFDHF